MSPLSLLRLWLRCIPLAAACLLATSRANAGTFVAYPDCSAGTFQSMASAVGYCSGSPPTFYADAFLVNQPPGTTAGWRLTAPPGLTITGVYIQTLGVIDVNDNQGWGGGYYFAGGGGEVNPNTTNLIIPAGSMNSSYFAMWIVCGWSPCHNAAWIETGEGGVKLTLSESQGPSLLADGSNNLWYQGGHYIWNPPGDPWPLTLQSSDPSGVCSTWAIVDQSYIQGPTATPVQTQWQECPDPLWEPANGARVDTRDFVPSSGPLSLELGASNAATVISQVSETLQVDNDPVTVSLATPNDPNPTLWVNHPVTVTAQASAGPSGIGGMNCMADNVNPEPYPAHGVTVDGTGVHTVTCTAWNNAVDPQGGPNFSSSSTTVHIDETPPALSFEPQQPAAPTSLVVDTTDAQSGVSSGSIRMAPSGTQNWENLPTTFDGQHLLAQIDDAGRSGPYVIEATSCDAVGNCATTSETLTLPLRLASASAVSFTPIEVPAQIARTRVLVGWHWLRARRHGRMRRLRVGGHFRVVRIVIPVNTTCATRRVRTGPRRWREIQLCRVPHVAMVQRTRVPYGRPVTVHGLVATTQGVPIGNAPVEILTAPDNGLNQFAPAASVTTDATGTWTVSLPAGPSRLIDAVYSGSNTLLPATGQASLSVPARIGLSAAPRALEWNRDLVLHGHLTGGYIPPDGVALRLMVRYTDSPAATDLLAFRTNSRGTFKITWSYRGGHGVATYPFWVATTATESDYPFAPSRSRRLDVTFGAARPTTSPASPHRRRHAHPRRRHHRPPPTTRRRPKR